MIGCWNVWFGDFESLRFEIRSLIPWDCIGNRSELAENFLLHIFLDRNMHFWLNGSFKRVCLYLKCNFICLKTEIHNFYSKKKNEVKNLTFCGFFFFFNEELKLMLPLLLPLLQGAHHNYILLPYNGKVVEVVRNSHLSSREHSQGFCVHLSSNFWRCKFITKLSGSSAWDGICVHV